MDKLRDMFIRTRNLSVFYRQKKGFIAVLGGIGSIPGAMAGGFAIGIAEALVSSAGLSEWKDGVVFAILIVVLLVKPTGLMGRPMTEKV